MPDRGVLVGARLVANEFAILGDGKSAGFKLQRCRHAVLDLQQFAEGEGGVGMQVDEARNDEMAFRIDLVRTLKFVRCKCDDLAIGNADIEYFVAS